eukprot:11002_1
MAGRSRKIAITTLESLKHSIDASDDETNGQDECVMDDSVLLVVRRVLRVVDELQGELELMSYVQAELLELGRRRLEDIVGSELSGDLLHHLTLERNYSEAFLRDKDTRRRQKMMRKFTNPMLRDLIGKKG